MIANESQYYLIIWNKETNICQRNLIDKYKRYGTVTLFFFPEIHAINYTKPLQRQKYCSIPCISLPSPKFLEASYIRYDDLNNYYNQRNSPLKGIKTNKAHILRNLSKSSKFIAAPQYRGNWQIQCQLEHYTYDIQAHSLPIYSIIG